MKHHSILLFIFCLLLTRTTLAQTTPGITTLPLEVSAVCPGSVIAVPFSYTGKVGKVVVQLSSGDSFTTINTETKTLSTDNQYPVSVHARIPDSIETTQIYQVRVVGENSSVISQASPTRLMVRGGAKPPKPVVDSLVRVCSRSSANDYMVSLYAGLVPNAAISVYIDENGPDFPTGNYRIGYSFDKTKGYIEVYKGFQTYPCNLHQRDFYFTQTVDGCESDKAKMVYQVWCREEAFKFDEFVYSNGSSSNGRTTYCQGDTALPLDKKGYKRTNEANMYVLFGDSYTVGSVSTTVVPTPNTDKPGRFGYYLRSVPHPGAKVCASFLSSSYLDVVVNPRPPAPTLSGLSPIYEKDQPALALTATTSSTATSLRWYLPDATGVPSLSSATAPVPPTDRPGSFTYLVSQVQGNCEGPRVPITVEVVAEDVALSKLVSVYPVPALGETTVELNAGLLASGPAVLELLDGAGHVLWEAQTRASKTVIPLQSLSTGSYNVRVRLGERQATKRVLKL
ncbi:MAG: T9SS C-terminal target domain-containing protein [Cytophagales bacterium]|nr:MAG: T9SS C-terminal target domain-containing protein [Cytophagales bacterium]